MGYYVGIIHKDPETDYGLCFPDFPGCVAAENNLEGLKAAAEAALAGHLQLLAETGAAVPPPPPIEAIMTDPSFADGLPALIHARDIADPVVRVNVTFKRSTLAAIDRNAAQRGRTRSALLAHAAGGDWGEVRLKA